MITLLYGTYGSGKSKYIIDAIREDTAKGIHTFLIVPEQEVVQSERSTLLALPNSAQLNLEVLSFSRLYNRVCREYGGLSYRYITKPVSYLLMWQTLRNLTPELKEFNKFSENDTTMCEVMLLAISECKASAITSEKLEEASERLPEDSPLKKKLEDLCKIYVAYNNAVTSSYSDSSDDISRLYETLKKERFFKGTHVYIDSFTSFTAAEHNVIEKIFADADNVTVSIPLPCSDYNGISVKSIKSSQERLVKSAEKLCKPRNVKLGNNKRAVSKTLAYIAENLWRLDLDPKKDKILNDGSITVEECDNPYAEAEAVANRVLELLRNGERCKDMLVLMRDPEIYRGIIEPAFEKNGIPFYFSEKTDLNSLPPVKLLLSALKIKQHHWQKNDIISHIKTGMYSIPQRSCDLFEEYVNTWNIHGSGFCNQTAWTMNPDGYIEDLSERGREILVTANEVRYELISKLERFFILLDASTGVPDMCRAVYSYFNDINIEERLRELAVSESERGNFKSAGELASIYGIILEALADIATALPDTEASTEEFALMLRTVFNQTDIGTIPTSVDEVTIGSAATLRASNPKYTFVLGLCEGEFPMAINDSGIFSSADKDELKQLELVFSSNSDTCASDELMYAQRAFATPSHGLYLSTSVAEFSGKSRRPSMPYNRVLALLAVEKDGDLEEFKPHKYSGNDISYTVGAPRSAVSHLKALEDTPDGVALRNALDPHLKDCNRISQLPLSAGDITLSEKTVNSVFGNKQIFSSTSFERYVKCPMSYYCANVLHLREKVNSDFLASDMGTFVHEILKHLIKYAVTPDKDGKLPTDDEITAKTEAAVIEYIDKISPKELRLSKKLSHIYKRLKALALLMVRNIAEEFSHSDFTPEYFELPINGEGDNPPLLKIKYDENFSIYFKGQIDRVDILKKDGKVYVRVIDYKTGSKKFSLDDVEHGINTQMLLYLSMLCNTPGSKFCEKLGLQGKDAPSPAGIMYLSANVPMLRSEKFEDEDTVCKNAENELKRSGLLLSNPEILEAMNHEFSRKFLAGIYKTKDGIKGDALTSDEKFEEIFSEMNNTIKAITAKLREGKAGATPLRYGSNDPCEYCKMKPVCRKDEA